MATVRIITPGGGPRTPVNSKWFLRTEAWLDDNDATALLTQILEEDEEDEQLKDEAQQLPQCTVRMEDAFYASSVRQRTELPVKKAFAMMQGDHRMFNAMVDFFPENGIGPRLTYRPHDGRHIGKAAAVEVVGTTVTDHDPIAAARRKAEDIILKQLVEEQLSKFFTTQETPMPPAAAGEEDAIPGGNESRAGGMDQNVHEYYHAACYGAFIAGSTIKLRKLLAAACVTEGITPAFGQRLEAIVHSMEAIDDGHRFRVAYLRKHWDTQMHHGDTFALDVVREHYFRLGTDNHGSPEFSELVELYKDRVYDANIASAAKTTARQRSGGALRRNDRGQEGGGGIRENFKTTRPVREAVAPRAIFANDATKDSAAFGEHASGRTF
eukprot:jgi/Tetstr1/458460/TSEL_004315.t1